MGGGQGGGGELLREERVRRGKRGEEGKGASEPALASSLDTTYNVWVSEWGARLKVEVPSPSLFSPSKHLTEQTKLLYRI